MHVRPRPLAAPPATASVVLTALLLTGCAAGADVAAPGADPSTTAASPTAPSATPSPTSSSPEALSSPSPSVRTVEAAYADGDVTGTSGREQVSLGERVVLRISSDVAEQVHVHGYDLQRAVPAGGTVEIPLQATVPGVFEVELHESGRPLFQLRVS